MLELSQKYTHWFNTLPINATWLYGIFLFGVFAWFGGFAMSKMSGETKTSIMEKVGLLITVVFFLFMSPGLPAYFHDKGIEANVSLTMEGERFEKCKLLETNINNGWLSANTNRILCDDVIENIETSFYNAAIKAHNSFVPIYVTPID